MKKLSNFIAVIVVVACISANAADLKALLKHEKNGGKTNPVLMFDIYNEYSKLPGDHNIKQSYLYLRKAAELGHAEAAYMLYEELSTEPKITFSKKEDNDPIAWLKKANKFGHLQAEVELNFIELENAENSEESRNEFIDAIKGFAQNSPDVWLRLSRWYRQNSNLDPKQEKAIEAARNYIGSADNPSLGHLELANIEKAKDAPDLEKLVGHLKTAVSMGSSEAHLELGKLMVKGDYNSRVKAHELLVKAYKMGEADAKPYLTELVKQHNTPIIYNIPLYHSQRSLVQERLTNAGAFLKKSKGYLDYFGGKNINGADELIAAYDIGEEEILAQLTFVFKNDTIGYAKMFNAISEKYGQPKNLGRFNINRNRSKYGKKLKNEYLWSRGAATIRLIRNEGDDGVMKLEYIIEPHAQRMARKLKEAYKQGAESGKIKNVRTY